MRAPLLAQRRLADFSPEEFKKHVRSLFKERRVRKAKAKTKRPRDYKVTVRRLKSGKISVKTKRSPKYVTREEYAALCLTYPENELFIALRAAETHIYETHSDADKILLEEKEFPW